MHILCTYLCMYIYNIIIIIIMWSIAKEIMNEFCHEGSDFMGHMIRSAPVLLEDMRMGLISCKGHITA